MSKGQERRCSAGCKCASGGVRGRRRKRGAYDDQEQAERGTRRRPKPSPGTSGATPGGVRGRGFALSSDLNCERTASLMQGWRPYPRLRGSVEPKMRESVGCLRRCTLTTSSLPSSDPRRRAPCELPAHVGTDLRPCSDRGPRAAKRSTIYE